MATTGLVLSFPKHLQPGDELGLPGHEVGFNAAMLASDHITVALPSGQHATGPEHPQPLVHAFTNLQEKQMGEPRVMTLKSGLRWPWASPEGFWGQVWRDS